MIYEKKTQKTFEEAVNSITEELKKREFGVLWNLNFKEKMAEHDIDFKNNFMILEVCNPEKAKEVLTKHIDMGYFLPCKMVVYENEGNVMIGAPEPKKLMSMMGYDDLENLADEVQTIMIEAIDAAV